MTLYTFTTEGEFTIYAHHWFVTRREAEAARKALEVASPVEVVKVPREKRALAAFLNRYTRQ